MGATATGLLWSGGGAVGGAGVSVAGNAASKEPLSTSLAASGGAAAGLGLTLVGGLIVALVSEKNRNAGLATAGFSLAGLLVVGVARSL